MRWTIFQVPLLHHINAGLSAIAIPARVGCKKPFNQVDIIDVLSTLLYSINNATIQNNYIFLTNWWLISICKYYYYAVVSDKSISMKIEVNFPEPLTENNRGVNDEGID